MDECRGNHGSIHEDLGDVADFPQPGYPVEFLRNDDHVAGFDLADVLAEGCLLPPGLAVGPTHEPPVQLPGAAVHLQHKGRRFIGVAGVAAGHFDVVLIAESVEIDIAGLGHHGPHDVDHVVSLRNMQPVALLQFDIVLASFELANARQTNGHSALRLERFHGLDEPLLLGCFDFLALDFLSG